MKELIIYLCICLPLCLAINNCLYGTQVTSFCRSPGDATIKECDCVFIVDEGYQIEVIVEYLNIDSSAKNHFLMTTGPHDTEYKFSWHLDNSTDTPKKFIIDKNLVTIKYVNLGTDVPNNFSFILNRYGVLTTTLPSTTENIFPTPVANDSIFNTIYLSVTPQQFLRNETDFIDFMVTITKQFTTKYKFDMIENITDNNIKIQYVQKCFIEWPNSDKCIEIKYAIPVVLNDTKYELVTANLQKMWDEFGTKNITNILHWKPYEVPNDNYSLILWLSISVLILIVFFLFLIFIKGFAMHFNVPAHRRPSDTENIMGNSNRASTSSLWPMSSQIVPPIFDNESPCYYYEPDSIPHSFSNQLPTKAMINVDELSDDEILNVADNSTKSNFPSKQVTLVDNDLNRESAL